MEKWYFYRICFQAASPLTIIQLSDIHHQQDYLPGGNAACGLPLCCRINQGPPLNPDAAAGYWGNGGCDVPMHHFENTLEQIKKTHKVKNPSFSIG